MCNPVRLESLELKESESTTTARRMQPWMLPYNTVQNTASRRGRLRIGFKSRARAARMIVLRNCRLHMTNSETGEHEDGPLPRRAFEPERKLGAEAR